MAITFTQVPVTLRINKAAIPSVIDVLNVVNGNNPNNIYTIETSFHVGSIEQAETVLLAIETLKSLGVLDSHQANDSFNQIKGFRDNYLR